MSSRFDKAYFDRYYRNPKTRVVTRRTTDKLAAFVASYLKHVNVPVRRVLDIGCGLGLWRQSLQQHYPRASYQGVEISDYVCEKYGWTKGSVVDYRARGAFDLVICQGVLQYLDDRNTRAAIANLAKLCRGALYLEALTTADWENNCDRRTTDGRVHLRSGSWYRRQLSRYFQNCGGGLFLAPTAQATLFELEHLE
ncbi:MAG: class I SAM-dependent methyltransferase [Planctomycetota bacterium]